MTELSEYRYRIGLFVGVLQSKILKTPKIYKSATSKESKTTQKSKDCVDNYNHELKQSSCYRRLFIFLVGLFVVCLVEAYNTSYGIFNCTDAQRTLTVSKNNCQEFCGVDIVSYKGDGIQGNVLIGGNIPEKYEGLIKQMYNTSIIYAEFLSLNSKTETKGWQTGLCLTMCAPITFAYIYVFRTCAYLIGNKGTHISNGNPLGSQESDDSFLEDTVNFVREHTGDSVGFIRVRGSHGTGFRVGENLFMTSYHLIKDEIDTLLRKISMHNTWTHDSLDDLRCRLDVRTQDCTTESHEMAARIVMGNFLRDNATDIPLLLQRMEGFVNIEAVSVCFTDDWKKNCVVHFLKHGQFFLDWRIQFADKDCNIVIMRLLTTQEEQTLPMPLILDQSTRQHGNIYIVRYIHEEQNPKVNVDQGELAFENIENAERNIEQTLEFRESQFPDKEGNSFQKHTKCFKGYNDGTGRIIYNFSESFIQEPSGSPIVCLSRNTEKPVVVNSIYHGSYAEFVHKQKTQVDVKEVPADCKYVAEIGTSMVNLADIIAGYGKIILKDEIFCQSTIEDRLRNVLSRIAAEVVTQSDLMDMWAQYRAGLCLPSSKTVSTHNLTAADNCGNAMPSDAMDSNVLAWEKLDKTCYITKAMEKVKMKIQINHYMSVTGVPGSGKSTTMRHAAIHLKNDFGFGVYPILHVTEFQNYFDRKKKQVFILDDVIGEFTLDNYQLRMWNEYNDKIKHCLGKNTKLLTAIRIQLWNDQLLKGKSYLFNDESHSTNLHDTDLRLNDDDMKRMMRQHLEANCVENVDGLIQDIWPGTGSTVWEKYESCFPFLSKVFSQHAAVRNEPKSFFKDPFITLRKIFTQIKDRQKHQFCGLALCSALDLNENYFSSLNDGELEQEQIELRNLIILSHGLDPKKDLVDIRTAVNTLDGIYVAKIGNEIKFLHSIFQNIVTFLYNDSSFVCKYGTREFVRYRVRFKSRLPRDDEYLLVYNSYRDVHNLVERFLQEIRTDVELGSVFIVRSPCIDDDRLISCLQKQLFENKCLDKYLIDYLCWHSVEGLCHYKPRDDQCGDITKWRGYKLVAMLLQGGADCNKQFKGKCPIHVAVDEGCIAVINFLLQHGGDINALDENNRCVLHWAVDDINMTRYLFSLRSLTCLNQADIKNRTPYWYILQSKWPSWYHDGCYDRHIPYDQKLIDIYTQKGAML